MESSDSAQRIDRLLKRDDIRQRFELAWRAGANPSLGQFLEEVAFADRGKLFVDLLGVELELRRERGEAPTATEYREHHPEYAAHIDAVFREAADQTRISPADLRPGSVLGDFRITREIGRGGMGVVYEAEQMSLGRQVALKVLTPDRHALDNPRARFVREARAAAGLHHTNIVPVLEVGEHDGILYYAMQLIQGRPLDRVLADLRQQLGSETSGGAGAERERSDSRSTDHQQADCDTAGHPSVEPSSHDVPARPAGAEHPASAPRTASLVGAVLLPDRDRESWRHVSRIGRQVAEALQYAHERGILHRDIKPANLLVDAQHHVWVTDFGLAKVEDSDLTHRNDVVGTLRYLAPEALDGQTDERSDVYSLGLTLYELLSFRSPFPARERSALLRQIRGAEIIPLPKIAPGVPHDLATIVSKAIQREPRDRYQTAQQLADDLDRFWHDQPILARRHSAAELLVRWVRRNPTVAGLAGALASVAARDGRQLHGGRFLLPPSGDAAEAAGGAVGSATPSGGSGGSRHAECSTAGRPQPGESARRPGAAQPGTRGPSAGLTLHRVGPGAARGPAVSGRDPGRIVPGAIAAGSPGGVARVLAAHRGAP